MNWQDGGENNTDSGYAAPKVMQLKLDPGGNYVSPAWALKDRDAAAGGIGTLGGSQDI